MQTKLTLQLEEELVARAKEYADRKGISLSRLVSDCFRLLADDAAHQSNSEAPITSSLRGILKGAASCGDCRRHTEEERP